MKAIIAILLALTVAILLIVPMDTLLNIIGMLTVILGLISVLLGLIALFYIPMCMFSDDYKDWKWERKFAQWKRNRTKRQHEENKKTIE